MIKKTTKIYRYAVSCIFHVSSHGRANTHIVRQLRQRNEFLVTRVNAWSTHGFKCCTLISDSSVDTSDQKLFVDSANTVPSHVCVVFFNIFLLYEIIWISTRIRWFVKLKKDLLYRTWQLALIQTEPQKKGLGKS